MPDLSQYAYDLRSRRYRNLANGQYVTASEVRQAVDTVIDVQTAKVRDLSQRLIDGQINLAEWQTQTVGLLKPLYVAVGMVAGGGVNNMSQADYGFLGSLIKKQYTYLAKFAQDIASGKQKLDGSLLARAALYAQAARSIFETVLDHIAREAGAMQERSILGISDHCRECVQEAAKGWQPIGTLIPIGERLCRANCRCSMIQK
jgi:hypothetical protein